MKKFGSLLASLVVVLVGTNSAAGDNKSNPLFWDKSTKSYVDVVVRGGDQPFPLKFELFLPFEKLDGFWQTVGPMPLVFKIENLGVFAPTNEKMLGIQVLVDGESHFAKAYGCSGKGAFASIDLGDSTLKIELKSFMLDLGKGKGRPAYMMKLTQVSYYGELISEGMFKIKKIGSLHLDMP